LVDTTGAGDLYAAGFLFGYSKGYDLEICGRLASVAAAEIISHIGARPEIVLSELARQRGLI
jgi:sugar/nucleoside kinase (ribokinase family)